jgi:hypothetical protein
MATRLFPEPVGGNQRSVLLAELLQAGGGEQVKGGQRLTYVAVRNGQMCGGVSLPENPFRVVLVRLNVGAEPTHHR